MTSLISNASGEQKKILFIILPMRTDLYVSAVRRNNSNSVLVSHLAKNPTSIQTKLDPLFVANIENSSNPSAVYSREMKQLYREELGKGLRERAESWKLKQAEEQAAREEYRSKINGVVGELQKNGESYNKLLERKVKQQESRCRLFVNEAKLKEDKLSNFIHSQQDRDVFNHESDLYQQLQKVEQFHTMEMLQTQKENRQQEQQQMAKTKARELEQRRQYERDLESTQMAEKQERVSNQMRYQLQLSGQVQEKKVRDSIDTDLLGRSAVHPRHNPITNPLEFHIDNPYLLRQMQQRRLR